MSFDRQSFDDAAYVKKITQGNCFICEIAAGTNPHVMMYEDEQAMVFWNKYPTVYGYALVTPRQHLEQVSGDFSLDAYLALQKVVYATAEALRAELNPARVYICSLGSQEANRHVHWHVIPLPHGVPFEQQQLYVIDLSNGYLAIPHAEQVAFAERMRVRISDMVQG